MSKATEQRKAVRARYTWHLRPPFNSDFDCAHWWNGQEVDPIAAAYELARRHPVIGDAMLRFRKAGGKRTQEPAVISCLCEIGLHPWSRLTGYAKDAWQCSAGVIKGVDCRYNVQKCCSITDGLVIDALTKGGGCAQEMPLMTAKSAARGYRDICRLMENPMSIEARGAIERETLHYHQKGYLLIAIAPDLPQDEAESLLAKQYRDHRSLMRALTRSGKQRGRCENWLALIADFEHAEAAAKTRKNQVFARYRRAMDKLQFPAV